MQFFHACMIAIFCSAAFAAPAPPNFETDIGPIFARRCAGCHSPSADRLKGKLDLSTAEATLAGGASGPAIVPGDASASPLVAMIEWRDEPHMPPSDKFEKLPQAEIDLVRAWIDSGALSGAPPAPVATAEAVPPATAHAGPVDPASAPSSAVAFSPDGMLVARGTLQQVELFKRTEDGAAAERVGLLAGHAEMVRALAFSPDGALLAAAGGAPGRGGEVRLWRVADQTEAVTFSGHSDNILDIAFSPDGSRLVSCSYDKLIKVWDVASGGALHTLKDHVDAVYTVAFSPDGAMIASGAGDRTVKLWDAATGERLITFSDSTDVVNAIAYSPDGKFLAGACGDKTIRIWDIPASMNEFTQTATSAGVLSNSAFAHEGAVLDVAYSPDGRTLYSTGEDARLKAWDIATLTEKQAFEPQPDWVLGLAVSPDGAALAAARYDASLALYATADASPLWRLNDAGDVLAARPAARKVTQPNVDAVFINATIPPSLGGLNPVRMHRGAEFELEVSGKNLAGAEAYFLGDKVRCEIVSNEALPIPEFKYNPQRTDAQIYDDAQPHKLKLKVTIDPDASAGTHFLFCRTPLGITEPPAALQVLPWPDTAEVEPNNTPEEAQQVQALPATMLGGINAANDVDRFRFLVEAGQELSFAVTDAGIEPIMTLRDANGEVLRDAATNSGGTRHFGHRFDSAGACELEIRDAAGRANLYYRLHVGAFPQVAELDAVGVTAGPPQPVQARGLNFGAETLTVDPPDEAKPWQLIGLPLPAVEGNPIPAPRVHVSPYPVAAEAEPNDEAAQAQALDLPASVDGQLDASADLYRFRADRDEAIIVETVARRVGSNIDTVVEVLDAQGALLQRAQARCVAQTMMTLSDRDSRAGGLRLEDWAFLGLRDYVMVGSEILQVRRLPGYADEDMSVFTFAGGPRMGMFGTTPEHHAVGTPVYKVEILPPGEDLAPNGMPVFPIHWRNDDWFYEGSNQGDSRLEFVAPADGEYLVRVRDALGGGSDQNRYRLMLRSAVPDFELSAGPYRLNIHAGGRVPLDLRVRRHDGFDAPVQITAEGLPAGFSIDPAIVLPDEENIKLMLHADEGASSMETMATFNILATAQLLGETATRKAVLGEIHVVKHAPDLVVHREQHELILSPGGKATLSVRLERNNGFTSRVPLEMLNLPYGVRVIDTGLNGILVREGETERSMTIYCEPWVAPLERSVFVQARIESVSPGRMLFLGEPIALKVQPAQVVASAE